MAGLDVPLQLAAWLSLLFCWLDTWERSWGVTRAPWDENRRQVQTLERCRLHHNITTASSHII